MKPWKVQKFFEDLLYDLRSRNLLLPAIALVIAIIAVPVLLSRSSDSTAPASTGNSVALSASSARPEAQTAVVAYDPGVRNFKQRLRGLAAKDPFRQQFPAVTEAAGSTTSGSGGSTESFSTPGNSGEAPAISGGTNSGTTGGSGGGTKTKTKTVTKNVTYRTSVVVGEAGGAQTMINGVAQFAFLPSADKPVIVYLGTSEGGSQAIFMVSRDVTGVGGNGTCFPTADQCQLLGLNAGGGADLIYGPDGKTYHLQVAAIKRIAK